MAKLFHIGSDFWKQVLTLFSGSLLAQVISALFLPILSRLYLPEAFGILGIFVAAVAVLVVLINGGYELTIMLPEKDADSELLMRLSMRIAHVISLGLLIFLVVLGPNILVYEELQVLSFWYLLLPISIWMEGMIQALGFRLNRMKAYKALSLAKLIRSALTAFLGVSLAFVWPGFEGLWVSFLIGQAGMALYSYIYYLRNGHKIDRKITWKELQQTAKRYADFPRYSVLSACFNTASKHLPFFLFPKFYGASISGQFSKADRILNLPVVLISMSIGRVFFEQASRAEELGGQALAQLSKDTFLRLLAFATPFFLIVMLWAPEMFSFVLGEPWRLAGEYARCLMPWVFMVFMASPLAFLIDIKRKLKVFLYFNIALFAVRLLALVIGANYFDDMGTLWVFGLSGAGMVLIQLLYLLWLGGVFRSWQEN